MLEILKYPDPRLKLLSKPVTLFDKNLQRLLDAMAETMYAANGVGLAAPQVGELLRVFVIDVGAENQTHRQLIEIINPTLSKGEGKIVFEEACLSVPGVSESIQRKSKIFIEYQNRYGDSLSMTAEDLLAVAIQHETDHLDGILFVDRLSPLKRKLIRKKLDRVVTL